MNKVSVVAKLPAAPGKRDALAAALQPILDAAEDEAGTILYLLNADAQDENLLWFYELYADQAALDAHLGSEVFRSLGDKIGPFLGGAPELIMMRPLGGKGL